jgi:5'(3')-deoxyribonucleotidase
MDKKQIIYFDMDGVLADFNAEPNAVQRYAVEQGFFKSLKPRKQWLHEAKEFTKVENAIVRVISASPNEQADQDKIAWLSHYFPELPKENIFLCRVGENKAHKVPDVVGAILFDDYGKNCKEWELAGGYAVKVA